MKLLLILLFSFSLFANEIKEVKKLIKFLENKTNFILQTYLFFYLTSFQFSFIQEYSLDSNSIRLASIDRFRDYLSRRTYFLLNNLNSTVEATSNNSTTNSSSNTSNYVQSVAMAIVNCSESQYYDPIEGVCNHCDRKCLSCLGSSEDQCIVCELPRFKINYISYRKYKGGKIILFFKVKEQKKMHQLVLTGC